MTPIRLSKAVKFLKDRYSYEVTRQTLYNWADKGKKHKGKLYVLATHGDRYDRYTTTHSLETIMSCLDIAPTCVEPYVRQSKPPRLQSIVGGRRVDMG